MSAKYPLAPFAVLYAIGIVVGTLTELPFREPVAAALTVVALASTLVVSVALLRRQRRLGLAWCALTASVLLLVVEVRALTTDPVDAGLGIGALLLLGWLLGIAGALTPRPFVHPSVRQH